MYLPSHDKAKGEAHLAGVVGVAHLHKSQETFRAAYWRIIRAAGGPWLAVAGHPHHRIVKPGFGAGVVGWGVVGLELEAEEVRVGDVVGSGGGGDAAIVMARK